MHEESCQYLVMIVHLFLCYFTAFFLIDFVIVCSCLNVFVGICRWDVFFVVFHWIFVASAFIILTKIKEARKLYVIVYVDSYKEYTHTRNRMYAEKHAYKLQHLFEASICNSSLLIVFFRWVSVHILCKWVCFTDMFFKLESVTPHMF